MECLRILFGHLFDILTLYLKFGIISLVVYFAAEWYVLRYEDLDSLTVTPKPEHLSSNSTANKIYRLILDFLIV